MNRRLNLSHLESIGEGIFGCTAVQVQAKMVTKQLMTISEVCRVPKVMSARGSRLCPSPISSEVSTWLFVRGAPFGRRKRANSRNTISMMGNCSRNKCGSILQPEGDVLYAGSTYTASPLVNLYYIPFSIGVGQSLSKKSEVSRQG